MPRADAEQLRVGGRAEWRHWLTANAGRGAGVWVVYPKGRASPLTYEDIVEEAVCFGWIDSTVRSVDATHSAMWMAPRSRRSHWSESNRRRVAALTEAGLMTDRGLAEVEKAKAEGRWSSPPSGALSHNSGP